MSDLPVRCRRDALRRQYGHAAPVGTIGTHESTRKLSRRLEAETARILSATVSRTAQRWFVSFTVEVERPDPGVHTVPESAIGIDLGLRALAATDTELDHAH
jgi:transposase